MLVKSLTFAAAALALGVLAAPASAAPVSGLKDVGIDTSSAAEPVHYRYRRCWRHRGHYHCRRAYQRYYYGYAPGYYSYAPGFYFSFGGHRHRHWGHRHRHW
jgi:hypothetical protein